MKRFAIAALLLAGCAPKGEPIDHDIEDQWEPKVIASGMSSGISNKVERVVDPEYNIACYVLDGYKRGGISCVPIPEGGAK